MTEVFLWYPRRVWQVKDGALVNRFMWLTRANDYTPSWRWLYQAKNFWMRNRPQFLKNRPRKFKPVTIPLPPNNPNAHKEFLEKWPNVEAFVLDRRPICKDPNQTYSRALLLTMVRRVIPNLIAQDLLGVQPMTGPVGEIFTMRHVYSNPNKE